MTQKSYCPGPKEPLGVVREPLKGHFAQSSQITFGSLGVEGFFFLLLGVMLALAHWERWVASLVCADGEAKVRAGFLGVAYHIYWAGCVDNLLFPLCSSGESHQPLTWYFWNVSRYSSQLYRAASVKYAFFGWKWCLHQPLGLSQKYCRYKWEAYCNTNWMRITTFPFLQGLEGRKAQRYKWGAHHQNCLITCKNEFCISLIT